MDPGVHNCRRFRVLTVFCVGLLPLLFVAPSCTVGGSFIEIDEFWDNAAHFEFVSRARFPSTPGGEYAMNVGFHIVPHGGVWWLFHREYAFEPQPSYCPRDYARVVVRQSTDKGKTWSQKTVIASPLPNTSFECAVVDGAGFFDVNANTWHYIGQCLARDGHWNLCHWFKDGNSPNGTFGADVNNPIVRGGQLWSQICNTPGATCDPTTVDEGTPEIVKKDNDGDFWITFHGYSYKDNKAFRGVAKTSDFIHWVVAGPGLPGDAIFGSVDCNGWNISWAAGGCVGGGEGSILISPDSSYMYHLIEAPDVSLSCLQDQNWVLGLLRAREFLPTGHWAQFRVVPTVVPIVKKGCYIQYHRLFADSEGTYLEFWAAEYMQIFQLVDGPGPLPIVAGPPPSSHGLP